MRIILSSANPDKVREIKEILGEAHQEVISKAELGMTQDVEETGETLRANAYLKADAIYHKFPEYVVADDTGLFVDALGGRPGVYAARYAGEHCSYQDNVDKMLRELDGVPEDKRGARFKTVICLMRPDGSVEYVEGVLKGGIATEPMGSHGFGYDPIFIPEGYDISLGQMEEEEKNHISHRKKAFDALLKIL